MPLNTRITRDDDTLKMPNGWGGFHIAAMIYAATWDSGKGPFTDNTEPEMETVTITGGETKTGHFVSQNNIFDLTNYWVIAATPLNEGSYTLKRDFTFVDCHDGEVLELKAGDTLHAWRSHK